MLEVIKQCFKETLTESETCSKQTPESQNWNSCHKMEKIVKYLGNIQMMRAVTTCGEGSLPGFHFYLPFLFL